jgi:hypothetical protein
MMFVVVWYGRHQYLGDIGRSADVDHGEAAQPRLGGNGTLIGASANVTVTGVAEKDGKRIPFNEFTAFGSRVAGLTLLMSSAYLAMWLYICSTVVNVAGAVVLVGIFTMMRFGNSRPALN